MLFPEEQKLLCVTFKEMGYTKLRHRIKADFSKKKTLFVVVDLISNIVKYEIIYPNNKLREIDEKCEYNLFSSAIHYYNKI